METHEERIHEVLRRWWGFDSFRPVQEQIVLPLRAQNYATLVPGRKSERTVFTMAKFTIPDGKCLVVELNEKNGGRHQSFVIENEDLVRANTINELQVR